MAVGDVHMAARPGQHAGGVGRRGVEVDLGGRGAGVERFAEDHVADQHGLGGGPFAAQSDLAAVDAFDVEGNAVGVAAVGVGEADQRTGPVGAEGGGRVGSECDIRVQNNRVARGLEHTTVGGQLQRVHGHGLHLQRAAGPDEYIHIGHHVAVIGKLKRAGPVHEECLDSSEGEPRCDDHGSSRHELQLIEGQALVVVREGVLEVVA